MYMYSFHNICTAEISQILVFLNLLMTKLKSLFIR